MADDDDAAGVCELSGYGLFVYFGIEDDCYGIYVMTLWADLTAGVTPACRVLQNMPSGNLLGRMVLIVLPCLTGRVRVFRVYADRGRGGISEVMNLRVVS